MSDNFRFEIKKHIGVIAEYETGWKKEINIVSWNDSLDKYDIRDWDPTHEKMSKGITLTEKEVRNLTEILKELDLEKRRISSRDSIEKER